MFAKLKLWAAGVAASIAALVAMWFTAKSKGKQEAEAEQVKAQLEGIRDAQKIRDNVLNMSRDDVIDSLLENKRK